MIFPTRIAVALLWLMSALVVTDLPSAETTVPQRWAIVASDEKSQVLADLLTAELSSVSKIELVERERIRGVLIELELSASGLVEKNQALRFGSLCQADALVVVNATNDQWSKKEILRTRLIDARTAIRMLDVIVPPSNLDQEVATIKSELKNRLEKLTIPSDQLRLVSLSPVVSGEPGHHLRPLARTLSLLVASTFHRQKNVIVLEREDLDRLVRESELSGLDLKLRAATRLLETSIIRSPENQGTIARCRLTRLGNDSKHQTFEVTIESQDPDIVRRQLVDEIMERLDVAAAASAPQPNAIEADFFDKRARQFHSAYRPLKAADLSYTACVLSPTRDRLRNALMYHSSAVRQLLKEKKRTEALMLTRRSMELLFRQEQAFPSRSRSLRMDPTLMGRIAPGVALGGSSTPSPETKEQKSIYADIIDIQKKTQRLRLQRAQGDPKLQMSIRHRLLGLEKSRLDSHRVRPVTDLLRSMFQHRASEGLTGDISDYQYRTLIAQMIGVAKQIRDRSRDPIWQTDAVSWAQQLISLDERFGTAIRLMFQTSDRGPSGEQAARRLIDLLKADPNHTNLIVGLDSTLRRPALTRLPTQQRWEYLDGVVERCESKQDFVELLWHSSSLPFVMMSLERADRERVSQLALRIDKLLPKPASQRSRWIKREEMAAHREQQAGIRMRATLMRFLPRTEYRPYQNGLSLANAPAPWNEFVARPIKMDSPDRNSQVVEIFVDRREDARQRGGELILVRSRPKGKLSIDRLNAGGGKLTKIGPDVPGRQVAFRGVQIAVGDDAVYVASENPGFLRLTKNGFQEYNESNGAASNDVWKLAWFDQMLFVAYADAFGKFDPATERFDLLASSTSVEASNPIDARGSFFIRTLMPDRTNECLWMTIQDNAVPRDRNGFWKFTPRKIRFEKLSSGHVRISPSGTKLLINRSVDPKIALFDPATSRFQALPSLANASKSRSYPTHLIKIGDYLVDEYARLISNDGTPHRLPGKHRWDQLERLGNGFITHHDRKQNVIWYVEPKPPIDSDD